MPNSFNATAPLIETYIDEKDKEKIKSTLENVIKLLKANPYEIETAAKKLPAALEKFGKALQKANPRLVRNPNADNQTRQKEHFEIGDFSFIPELSPNHYRLDREFHKLGSPELLIIFRELWKDEGLTNKTPAEKFLRQTHKTKGNLPKTNVRHPIKLALQALEQTFPASIKESPIVSPALSELDKASLTKLESVMREALLNHQFKRQRLLSFIGRGAAVLVAVATALTVFAALLPLCGHLLVVLGITSIPFLGYIIPGILSLATLKVNYHLFSDAVRVFLNNIFGGDKLFQGFTETIAPNGRRTSISTTKKFLLIPALFLAAAVGLGASALGYANIIALTALFTFISPFVMPYIAIGLAGVAFVCLTALMYKAFTNLIKMDFGSLVKGMFKHIEDKFDPAKNHGRSRHWLSFAKYLTMFSASVLTLFGVMGLGFLCFSCYNALSSFLPTILPLTIVTASNVSAAIMMLSFFGQIPFVALTVTNVTSELIGSLLKGIENRVYSLKNLINNLDPTTPAPLIPVAKKKPDAAKADFQFIPKQQGTIVDPKLIQKVKTKSNVDTGLRVLNAVSNAALPVLSALNNFGNATAGFAAVANFIMSYSGPSAKDHVDSITLEKSTNHCRQSIEHQVAALNSTRPINRYTFQSNAPQPLRKQENANDNSANPPPISSNP